MKKSKQNYCVAGAFALTTASILLCPREEALSDFVMLGEAICFMGMTAFGLMGIFSSENKTPKPV